jgi:phosphate-selective porin
MNNIGLGLIWHVNPAVRITGYYDIVAHELSDNLSGYKEDRKMNVFTLRLQYRW